MTETPASEIKVAFISESNLERTQALLEETLRALPTGSLVLDVQHQIIPSGYHYLMILYR